MSDNKTATDQNARIFSSGMEAAEWMCRNCDICDNYDADSHDNTECTFGNRIAEGFLGEAPTEKEARAFGGACFYNICSQRETTKHEARNEHKKES